MAFNERETMIADEVIVGKNNFENDQLKQLPPRFYIRRKSCCCKDCKLNKDFMGFDIVLDSDHPDNFTKKRKKMLKIAMKEAGKTSLIVKKLKTLALNGFSMESNSSMGTEKKKQTGKRKFSDLLVLNRDRFKDKLGVFARLSS
jgi:hypothetical protein